MLDNWFSQQQIQIPKVRLIIFELKHSTIRFISIFEQNGTISVILFQIKLSAETYGYRTNANGKSLRNKQVWTLSPSGDGESVVLRSHLDRYIAVDQFGNVTCDQVYCLRTNIQKLSLSFIKTFS